MQMLENPTFSAHYVTPLEHEKAEWSRMAQAAYNADRNDVGHRFSAAATWPRFMPMPLSKFDSLQAEYRAWLAFGIFRDVD
jgi:hypothetical protein